jgi:hypothetical protein
MADNGNDKSEAITTQRIVTYQQLSANLPTTQNAKCRVKHDTLTP